MIKKSIAIFLISTYCLIIFKDFAPQLMYKLNFDYIVNKLCEQKDEVENICMGNCYLNKKVQELIDAQKETEGNSKNIPATTNTRNLETHLCSLKSLAIESDIVPTGKYSFYNNSFVILSNNIKPILPPPKFIIL